MIIVRTQKIKKLLMLLLIQVAQQITFQATPHKQRQLRANQYK